jgi:exopolysaccharide biosynthesis polyprenyl glycosylphosphotransferase
MNKQSARVGFIVMDFLTGALAWSLFFMYRKIEIEHMAFEANNRFWLGAFLIPFFWVLIYGIMGMYKDVVRLHRLKIISQTIAASLMGVIVLFFALLLDDQVQDYLTYYKAIAALFLIHFLVTLIPRFILISYFVKAVQSGSIGFKTLLVGGSEKAIALYEEIKSLPKSMGHQFVGFVNLNGIDTQLKDQLTYLGHADGIKQILEQEQIEEVIIALDTSEHEKLRNIVSVISPLNVSIKLIPDMYDILSGSVKMNNIFGTMLIEINRDPMPVWQQHVKRIMDIMISIVAMILLIPLYIVLAIWVKTSSKGPVFFKQERIGINGKKFQIIKFRTMFLDSEKNGPQLSSEHDPRITPAGKVMRKYRLDEFPQFFNVLIGEMSLVGPRPERQYYIDQISSVEPQYLELTRVRPGITSWGQVKYGYAENVDQMIQRMKYDLLYMRNMSLALDIKILFYTVLIVFMAKGK